VCGWVGARARVPACVCTGQGVNCVSGEGWQWSNTGRLTSHASVRSRRQALRRARRAPPGPTADPAVIGGGYVRGPRVAVCRSRGRRLLRWGEGARGTERSRNGHVPGHVPGRLVKSPKCDLTIWSNGFDHLVEWSRDQSCALERPGHVTRTEQ
jgi:hypothetical protein